MNGGKMKHKIRRLRRFVRIGWWKHVAIPALRKKL